MIDYRGGEGASRAPMCMCFMLQEQEYALTAWVLEAIV